MLDVRNGGVFVTLSFDFDLFVCLQRGEMTSFSVLTKEELEQEVSPEEVDEQDACVGQEIKELNSPFGNFLKNLLCGGGRERKARVESGEIDVNDDPTVQVIYFKGVLATKPLKIDNFNLLNCNKIIFYSRKSKLDIGLFVDFCEFTCFYQFLHDVLIKLFCRSKQNNFMSKPCKNW